MGIARQNGYSASVEGYFVLGGERIRLAKTNADAFVLAEPRAIPAGAIGELLVIVDGREESRTVTLPDGASAVRGLVAYQVALPF